MNHRCLQIAVADDVPGTTSTHAALAQLGHSVSAAPTTEWALVEHCRRAPPDLLIVGGELPGIDVIELAERLHRSRPLPVIVTAESNGSLARYAESAHILGCLLKPIRAAHLAPAIALAMRQFERLQELREKTAELRQNLAGP